jgi:hypothetical protein
MTRRSPIFYVLGISILENIDFNKDITNDMHNCTNWYLQASQPLLLHPHVQAPKRRGDGV